MVVVRSTSRNKNNCLVGRGSPTVILISCPDAWVCKFLFRCVGLQILVVYLPEQYEKSIVETQVQKQQIETRHKQQQSAAIEAQTGVGKFVVRRDGGPLVPPISPPPPCHPSPPPSLHDSRMTPNFFPVTPGLIFGKKKVLSCCSFPR